MTALAPGRHGGALGRLAVALLVAAAGACDSGADGGGATGGPAETCEATSERFTERVAGAVTALPDVLVCATSSDCTAATPRLECQRGGETTGILEACPVAVARDQLQAWTSYLGDQGGDFCPTECVAVPACQEMDAICDGGVCALVPSSPQG